jgi:hypothetical protein
MIDQNREAVQSRLKALGFEVQPIPETSSSKMPDLVVQMDGVRMFVEVKTRSEDRVLRNQMESVHIGGTATILTDLDKHNNISAEIKKAVRQLNASATDQDFRLLWYRADSGLFVQNTKEQIASTLFGMRLVLAECQPLEQRAWYCAYAGYADFYRFSEIDGVMVEEDRLISLFLNPFSPRRESFASCRITRILQDSVFDVDKAIVQGKLFVADGEAPRGDDKRMLEHLRSKYPSVRFMRFLRNCSGTIITTIDGSKGGRADQISGV